MKNTLRSRATRARALALRTSERGAELVEMAIVLPLLLLVMMGIVDFAFMFQRFLVLTNAAVEGARVGTLPGYSLDTDVPLRVQDYATGGGVPGTVSTEAVPTTVPAPGGGTWPAVQVTVSQDYTLDYIGPIAAIFGGSDARTVTLRARSTMRRQIGGE